MITPPAIQIIAALCAAFALTEVLPLTGQLSDIVTKQLTAIVTRYEKTPPRNISAATVYIHHVRTIAPCSGSRLSIDILDALTGSDIIFLDSLATIAYNAGYAERYCPFPSLNHSGRALYKEAEQRIKALERL